MGLIKLKKNRKNTTIQPRYYKGEGNPYELKHKFDDFRKTVNQGQKVLKESGMLQ